MKPIMPFDLLSKIKELLDIATQSDHQNIG